ncbi:MAG: rod shape-determining protein RodA [Coriobacteriia bacterium]|nr:rod shape-determining protein RodA [Coriobacteriia bacterium]
MLARLNIRALVSRWVHPGLMVAMILLITYGAVFLQTAVRGDDSWARQIQGIILGLILMMIVWMFDYRKLQDWLMPLFIVNIILLISPRIPLIGQPLHGVHRSIGIPGTPISLQPSEPAKIAAILLLAAIIARYGGSIDDWRSFVKVVGLSLIPFFAVMTQPDLGTALVFLVIMLGMLFVGGAKGRYMLALIAGGIALIGLVFWVNALTYDTVRDGDYLLLRNYQISRLTAFLDQGASDPQGAGYDLNQSQIAIGSGGLTGKGMGEGTQSQLNFISERATDYIFSVLGEEMGFVGTIALLGMYLALLLIALSIGRASSDLYGTLISVGIVSMWGFQVMQNIGMTMGLMPITGIPLPFMSYGLSAIVTNILACGVLFSIWSRRPYLSQTRGAADEISI